MVPASKGMPDLDAEYKVYSRYQQSIHHDSPDELSVDGFSRFLVTTPFEVSHMCSMLHYDSFLYTYTYLYSDYSFLFSLIGSILKFFVP